ncbi:MAG: epoxyqueuosine reductase [Desulfobacteraceae bacterium]|nr:MAG: epoxyqueuosine reductase [Desulfobacteraceae bacterium]
MEYTQKIKDKIKELGADLVGVADTEPLKGEYLNPPDLLEPFPRAVSIGLEIPKAVLATIQDRPTPLYKSAYQTANQILDMIASKTALMLQRDGYESLPIPASQVLDTQKWLGAISHKAIARLAGLGWQGKNLLLITPQFGSRIRLATILTSAPLVNDTSIRNRCGSCTRCQEACPAQAIKGVGTRDHYQDREEAFFLDRCAEKLVRDFSVLPEIGTEICGICIKVCPFS